MTGLLEAVTLATVVTLWHAYQDAEREALERSVAEANAALAAEEIRIETLPIPFDAYHNKIETTIPSGNGPDLFIAAHDRAGDWRRTGIIAPLPPGEGAAALPGLLEALSDEAGRPWAIPWTYKGLVLYRAVELFPEPVADVADLPAAARGLPPGSFALVYDTSSLFFHAPFLLGCGGAVFGEDAPDGSCRYRIFDEAAERSYALARDLRAAGLVPQDATSALAQQLFNLGRAGLVISGPWFAGGIRLDAARWTVDPLFAVEGRRAGSFITVEGLYLAATAPAGRDTAARAARALAAAWRPRTAIGHQPPTDPRAYDDPSAPLPALIVAQRDALLHGLVTPSRREMSWVWEPVGGLLKEVLDRGVPLAEALPRARQRLAVLSAPPPAAVDPAPYIAVAGVLLLAGAALLARRVVAARARIARARGAYLLALPAFGAMTALVVLPFAAGALMSFFSYEDGSWTFVGLGNFTAILFARDYPITDPCSFYFALGVTILWTAVNVFLHVAIGLALALLLRRPWMRLRPVYRVLLILPWAVPSYITALVWRGMFDFQLGAINGLLARLGLDPVAWFQTFPTAFAANVITNTWLGFPFMMVVSLGALQAIPPDLEEVAYLEGASRVQTFRHVIWPCLKPALAPAVVLGSVWTFNMFNVIYLVSGGEPGGATEILISEAYKWAFQRHHRYGYAAAYAVLIFGFLLAYGRLIVRKEART